MQTFHCCRFYTQITLLIFCVFVIPVFGQTESTWSENKCENLKEYLVELNTQNQFNGTVLIAENGEVKFHESVGMSNFEEERKLDSEAAFRLASVSKQFTCSGSDSRWSDESHSSDFVYGYRSWCWLVCSRDLH